MKFHEINWVGLITVVGYHVFLLIALPLYFYTTLPPLGMWIAAFVLFLVNGLGITAGYHRLYSHKAYELNKVAEFFILLAGTLALQNSVLKWSYDHRLHHTFVDQEKDPYNIQKGFWYAHMLWIFEKRTEPMDLRIVSDLTSNKMVMFQHKYYVALFGGLNLLICGGIGYMLGDVWGAILIVWWLRVAVTNHLTWFINSLAHTWGEKTYSKELSAVDNYILAFLTFGEGYHNYHHVFGADYRNGIKWYHFDPSKWLIWTLSRLGLARNLRTMDAAHIQRRLVVEDKQMLLEKVADLAYVKKEEMMQRIENMADGLISKTTLLREQLIAYKVDKKMKMGQAVKARKKEIRKLKKSLNKDLRRWCRMCRNILSLKKSL